MILSCDRVSLCCYLYIARLLVSISKLVGCCFPCITVSSCNSMILEYLEPSSLSCFVRRHSFFPSFSIFKSAVLDIQLFRLASFLALINFAFTCFSAVLFSDVGSDSATSLAVFSSLCSLSRSLLQYGLYSFLAPFGMASFAACRIHLVNSLTTLLISLS